MLLRPTGRFTVGVQDLKYCSTADSSSIAADNHVVARLYYPAKPAGGLLRQPLTWIRSHKYAEGYVSWGLRNPSTVKEKVMKSVASNAIFAIGLARFLPASYNAIPEDRHGKFPVMIFSHGAASMRNTCSILCSEFASRGFVVAAVEHADGTACCTQLATGEWRMLQGLGTGAVLEAKCEYRVQECITLAQALQAMSNGATIPGLSLSGPSPPTLAFKHLLDMNRLAIMGHSCGGATAAAAVAAHAEFKAGVALDPWWPLLPAGSAALNGWQTSSPLLVVGSQDWNTPGKMWCDGDRQAQVFRACLPSQHLADSNSNSSHLSRTPARTAVVAAAAAAGAGAAAQSLGGGAVQVVPAGSSHGSFTDLPFLLSPWLSQWLRKVAGAKSAQAPTVSPSVVQDVICWCVHNFLQDHLALAEDSPASLQLQQRWEQRLQLQQISSSSSSAAAGQQQSEPVEAAATADPAGAGQSLTSSGRRDSLVDHLAADENLIVADESAGHAAERASSVPMAHTPEHDMILENATRAGMAAQKQQLHLPVQQLEEKVYKDKVGDKAYLVAVHTR